MSDDLVAPDLSRTATLAEALEDTLHTDRGCTVYVPLEVQSLSPSTPCLWVLDLFDDVEADAREVGWRPGLGGDELRQVRANIEAQIANFDADLLVAAIDHNFSMTPSSA